MQTIESSGEKNREGSENRKGSIGWILPALLVVLFLIAVAGCRSGTESAPAFGDFSPVAFDSFTNRLHEGDVVNISFQYSTNLNTTQKIALDGTLNLDTAGLVKAAGKTASELQKELENLYRSQTKEDPITIKVIAAATVVYVTGAVLHPGKIQLERPMTVVEAIMEAGGVDPYRAKLSNIAVLRIQNKRQTVHRLDLRKMLSGEEETPFYLKPYDIVQVSTKTFNF